ncbi:flagellar hook protein FlgE [Roseibium denhamense]|uniref:Flagellar hook protein FlgE n=1 Tax=Roseibium denhamense TaxID=76305 RepID=A0ABY1PEQ7_9HYPH|nr:flagellar hook protein FlgE [Roseibium denhamense]MTI06241.1 flagellar hook protein FlgE [Roseibium denhamense]SMP32743.1 flagellar hook protein FlgE [Roseibium denhamense]
MGLYGVMRTGVSGMNAQSSKLGTVADNIANSGTTGYKRAETEFSSMVLSQGSGTYNSGGVQAHTKYAITDQGSMSFTTSKLDLAVDGNGFFIVSDGTGAGSQQALTRAGSFVPDGDGFLVNTAGYYLQGYPITGGAAPSVVANGLGGLQPVNITQNQLEATPTSTGTLHANLPDSAAVGDVVSTSVVVYDNLGNEKQIRFEYEKITDTSVVPIPATAEWELTVTGDVTAPVGPITLQFDTATGQMIGAAPVNVPITNGNTVPFDLSQSTHLDADFTITSVEADGNSPSSVESVEFGDDGTLYAIYENGDRRSIYKIPLADVPSPDKLDPMSGNLYRPSIDSGDVRVGFPGEAGLGDLQVGALEGSNVDLASELTSMIESQRTYTANSQVFKAGSDLLQELVNLVR